MRTIKNRKAQNKELERQKKNRNRLAAFIGILVLLVVAAGVTWVVWDTQSRSWIMRFEGQRIPVNELRVLMQGDTAEDRQMALDELTTILTLLNRAERHGAGLTEDERNMWAWLVSMEWGENPFIPAERLGEFIAAEQGEIWVRLLDIYIPESFVFIDEEQFAVDFENYKETNRAQYMDMNVMYILIDEREDAEAAYARLLAGEATFEEIVREFNEWLEDDDEVFTMPIHTLIEEAMFSPEEAAMLMELQAGEFSGLIEWGMQFGLETNMMVYVVNRDEADENEMAASLRRRQIDNERHWMLFDLVPQWVAQADYTVNRRALDRA
jgi:hypothetical protein